jgi:hypothetical protein
VPLRPKAAIRVPFGGIIGVLEEEVDTRKMRPCFVRVGVGDLD